MHILSLQLFTQIVTQYQLDCPLFIDGIQIQPWGNLPPCAILGPVGFYTSGTAHIPRSSFPSYRVFPRTIDGDGEGAGQAGPGMAPAWLIKL